MVQMKNRRTGQLDVICGPMFSGKSEELIKRLRRFEIAGLSIKIFNHALDIRYAKNVIASHSKQSWKAKPVNKAKNILRETNGKTDVVVVDEAQFFDREIVPVVNALVKKGIRVIVAGLDTNFRGEPFGSMPHLLALADGEVVKLRAVCAICKKWTATRTQRLLANKSPAPYHDPLVKIGAADSYEARCLIHHEVPRGKRRNS